MTTKTQLQETINRINRKLGKRLAIDYAYGRPRVTNLDGSREISPRLSRGELALWLAGFEECVDEVQRILAVDPEKD